MLNKDNLNAVEEQKGNRKEFLIILFLSTCFFFFPFETVRLIYRFISELLLSYCCCSAPLRQVFELKINNVSLRKKLQDPLVHILQVSHERKFSMSRNNSIYRQRARTSRHLGLSSYKFGTAGSRRNVMA